ncbi:ABC transporter permease [Ruegeria sp.]|uniref:ABC transporter permease n=1 Tax=Ruegeria sp. TaxID=1879320 RepID=UPI003AFFF0C5
MQQDFSEIGFANSQLLHRQQVREKWLLWALALPSLLIISFAVLTPLSWLFHLSFIGDDGNYSLENYRTIVEQRSYARTFATTFQVSICTTLICIALGFPFAYFLVHLPKRLASLIFVVVLLPCLTSLLVRTYAWLVLLQKDGLINTFALTIGLVDAPLQLVYNFTGTLVGMVHIMLPFFVLPVYSSISKIDQKLLPAAATLGARPSIAFCYVFLPLAFPAIAAGGLIVFILCLGFYVTPAVLGGGRVTMVSNQITAILENRFDWGAASALGVVLLLTTFATLFLLILIFRFSTRFLGRG